MRIVQSSSWRKGARLLAILTLLVIIWPARLESVGATDQARTISLGESNTQAQQDQVLDFLGAAETDQVVTVTVDETVQSMGTLFDVSGIDTAYSSTAMTCTTEGSGIEVTTRNIKFIPPEVYALALLTAGMSDVQLAVAAPDDAPALGMTAMTGVFRTWDMASCSGSGSDPVRRQLALEELALIAGIGQESGAVRQVTLVVMEAQQEIAGNERAVEELDSIVASRSEAAGLDLSAEDRSEIVAFLGRLARSGVDWGAFADGWSTGSAGDGSGVVLKANVSEEPVEASPTMPAGVGGATGLIAVTASPTASASPVAMDPVPTDAVSMPASTAGQEPGPSFMGTVLERGRDWAGWWPFALGIVALLLLGIGARRQPSETPTTWYVSRSRMFWLGRTMRRPAIVSPPRRRRRHIVVDARR